MAQAFGIVQVPALIAAHPENKKITPLAYGYISESEIEDRVNILLLNEAQMRNVFLLLASLFLAHTAHADMVGIWRICLSLIWRRY
ncbi:hypothetical protein MIDIC_10051 [Alphaproteobacteria bacterium]